MNMENTITKTEELLAMGAFDDSPEHETLFNEALKEELIFHYENNEMYKKFCERKNFNPYNNIKAIDEIPPVAVSVFKELGFKIGSVPKEEITLTLQSSATSGIPSSIVVDKVTSKRQSKAMVKVVGDFIGNKRVPFLIMDIDPKSADRRLLGARFAAVTGYLKFASKVGFFLKANESGISYFDVDAMNDYIKSLPKDEPAVVFGFTYILYQNVLKSVNENGIKFKLPKGSKIIHIGGWKKLESEKISKDLFNKQLAECFGIEETDVIDIYGFTEQMGLNYPDCKCGFKHESSYVKVLVRDPVSREILPAGKEGMLEFITPIPHSYPGNAVLTDDIGFIEDTPCPFGRSGKRFKIVGRLKKAEVRGCGDILSAKLKFGQQQNNNNAIDDNLTVHFFNGKIEGTTGEEQLQSIIKGLNQSSDWLQKQPIEALIGLINEASKKWLQDEKFSFLKDKGLLFLSQWCEKSHLEEVANYGLRGNIKYADSFEPFFNSDKHFLKANARGLVCHWLAGNVQILGFFALVQSIITKNVNLLKVAAADNGVFTSLIKTFEGLSYTTDNGYTILGDDILNTIAVVYFTRNARKLGEIMSESAKVRIAWGGKESVETVAGYPSSIDCETVIFGPKLSFAVIAKEELNDLQEVKKLARRVTVDASVFDQAGCASPHNIYIEKGGAVSPEEFCNLLAEIFPKTEIQIPKPTVSMEQVSAIHSARGVYDFKGKVWGSETMSWTVLYSEDGDLSKPVYSRVLMVHAVDDMNEAIDNITDYIQTIGIAAPEDRAKEFALKATAKGVARLPQIGRMLNFEMPWDGVFLIDRLVKWNTLFGPLR